MENITIQDIKQKVIDALKTVYDPEIPYQYLRFRFNI